MRSQIRSFIKNFSYSFLSNIVSVFINIVVLLILPKVLSLDNYGYYQLYMFYSGYTGFFHLGWCDGIYLRYGGKNYSQLDNPLFSLQFWSILFFEIILTMFISIFVYISNMNISVKFIFVFTLLTIIIIIPKTMLSYILQATNRIKAYSIVTISERIVFLLLLIILIVFHNTSYVFILIADMIGKITSLIISIFFCRTIVFSRILHVSKGVKEIILNISVGSKLMIANIASTLILGIIRQSIQSHWSIETFGKVSLSITISNMLMLFVGTVSIVLFPMLRRMESHRIVSIYNYMRTVLMLFLLGMLIFYYPVYYGISRWLPAYRDSLIYMSILFPVCIYESKMTMLINTYLKTLRKEKVLLFVNLLTVAMSFLLTFINVWLLNNLNMTIVSIIILFAFRCIISELILSQYIDILIKEDICLEIFLTIIFISTSWFIGGIPAFIIYGLSYTGYIFMKRKDLAYLLNKLKNRGNVIN